MGIWPHCHKHNNQPTKKNTETWHSVQQAPAGLRGHASHCAAQMASRGGLAIRHKFRAAFASLTCSQLWLIAACARELRGTYAPLRSRARLSNLPLEATSGVARTL